MTTSQGPASARVTGWVGWIVFCAAMTLLLGAFNVLTGLAALLTDEVFVAGAQGAVAFDVTTWGWVHLVLGASMTVVAVYLLGGATWARMAAVGFVMVNMISQLLFMPAYPFWALVIIFLDIVVLWALIVHGEEMRTLAES